MLRIRMTRGLFLAIVFAVASAAPSAALAGGRRRHACVNGDIDSLSARMCDAGAMEVCYKVEIEDFCVGDQFDLVLTLCDGGRVLCDARGRALRIVVRLDAPYKCSNDELKFKRTIVIPLPGAQFRPGCMSVIASLHQVGNRNALDRDTATVKYRH